MKYADNQVTAYEAAKAFDGNTTTFWAQQWTEPVLPLPHEIQIDLGAVYNITGFRYLPRQDGYLQGRIGQYEFYVSMDGTNWGTAVATGTFADSALEKEVLFASAQGRYIKLRGLTDVGNRSQQSIVAELNVLGTLAPTPTITKTATATATSTYTPTPSTPTGQVWKYYYYAGSQRVAVRACPARSRTPVIYPAREWAGSRAAVTRRRTGCLPRTVPKRRRFFRRGGCGVLHARRPPGLNQPGHQRERRQGRRDALPALGRDALRRRHHAHRLPLHRAEGRSGDRIVLLQCQVV